jgi:ribose 1,5-bisphosphate isomerase
VYKGITMLKVNDSIRAYLSPEAQKSFYDIVSQRILGASSHIKMISRMIRDLCSTARIQNESAGSLNAKIHQLAEFFIRTGGEASQAITNAIFIMIKGSDDQSARGLYVFFNNILINIEDFEKSNKRQLELINQFAQSLLSRMKSILLFDYSSSLEI